MALHKRLSVQKKKKKEVPFEKIGEVPAAPVLDKEASLRKLRSAVAFIMKEYQDSHIMTNAATTSFFMFISMVPILMIVMSVLQALPITLADALNFAEEFLPDSIAPLIKSILRDTYSSAINTSSLSISVILLIWSGSAGVSWMVTGVNDAYRTKVNRFWVTHRLMGLGYTLIFIAVLLFVLMSFVLGKNLEALLVERSPFFAKYGSRLGFFRSLFGLVVMTAFTTLIYQVFPRNKGFFLKQLPGSIVCSLGWYLFSIVYSYYVDSISNYSYTYGSLAAIVSMMLWMFICMFIIILGAEINYLFMKFVTIQREKHEKKVRWRKHRRAFKRGRFKNLKES